jgi:preprotein translocase subunit SecE
MASQVGRLKNQEMTGGASDSRESGFAGALRGLGERLRAYPHRLREYLHEVRIEMHQVTWPSRAEVISTTFVVLIAVAFFGMFFFGVDTIVSYFMTGTINYFKH